MKTQTILIVDDDDMITTTLSKVVTLMLKARVLVFNHPVQALEVIEKTHVDIDLVISDFIMPDLNGIEFLKKLKEIKPDIVSILLTGYADKQNAIKSINEIGIFNYMEKPWDNNNLIKTIQNGLEKKRLTDELNDKVVELEQRAFEIKDLYSRLEQEYRKETERSLTLEIQVAERTASIRNLLDNAGQGFLSFGLDMAIHSDYSVECRRIFGMSIQNADFAQLLYPERPEQQDYLKKLVERILLTEDDDERDLYLPLLPDFIVIGGLSIHLDYKIIKADTFSIEKQIMAILTDVTDKCVLASQMEQEKNTFKMVVKVITSQSDFPILVSEFQEFLREGVQECLTGNCSPREALNVLFRRVHTLKGNFSMMNMQQTVETLHQSEDKITSLLESIGDETGKDALEFILGAIDFSSGYEKDIEAIKGILGDQFHQSDSRIQIDRATLMQIEHQMADILDPADFMKLIPSIRALGYKTLRSILAPFTDYTIVLAEKYGKLINPVSQAGCDILIDPERYSAWIRSLGHVFRNAVVHGIEGPEERVAAGKDAFGSIACEASVEDKLLVLTISDDGRGIDREAVVKKSADLGLMTQEQAASLPDEELYALIFGDSFSTAQSIDQNAGRGIGLSAVVREMEKLGGSVSVESRVQEGTRFIFKIPYTGQSKETQLGSRELLSPVSKTAIEKIGDMLGGSCVREHESIILHGENIELYENSVFIDIEGQIRGTFLMSFDKDLSRMLATKDLPADMGPVSRQDMLESLSEAANIILGNSLGEFKESGDHVIICTPYTLEAADAFLRVPSIEAAISKISCEYGSYCVGIVKRG